MYDFIIVGGGSAGCVLANRLSANPAVRVLLLEAGKSGRHPLIRMPGGVQAIARFGLADWAYPVDPDERLNRREINYRSGRGLGGGSAINGMIYFRGHRADYDEWERLGNRNWGFDDVLPYFRRAERYATGDDRYRGREGPLWVSQALCRNPLDAAFLLAGAQAGYPVRDTLNEGETNGFAANDCTLADGRRSDTAHCYLAPVIGRKNLDVVTDTRVTRVVIEDGVARGVEFLRGGVAGQAWAAREVIVSAGAFGSPMILMHSGIGDPTHLADWGIACLAALSGVGRNLQDHVGAPVMWSCSQPVSLRRHMTPLGLLAALSRYLLSRTGPIASNGAETMALIRSGEHASMANLKINFLPILFSDGGRKLYKDHGFMAVFALVRPASRGRVRLQSANPVDAPRIELKLLDEEVDRLAMQAGLGHTRHILSQPAFADYRKAELLPGPTINSPDDVDAWLRRTASSNFHAAGTCRMSSGPDGVVDDHLRVHGIRNLRVADASIMPRIVSGNTNAPTIMIAEKAADMILENFRAR